MDPKKPETEAGAGKPQEAGAAPEAQKPGGASNTPNAQGAGGTPRAAPKAGDAQRLAELELQLKRVQAEFENYKKRTAKERETLLMAGSAATITKLLPVLDEMEVAVATIHHKASAKEIKEGMEMLHRKLHGTLEKEGLCEMKSLGEQFDPYRHEAVRVAEGKEDGRVAEVLKKGYMFRGSIIRHAMVVVTKRKEEPKEEAKKEKEGK